MRASARPVPAFAIRASARPRACLPCDPGQRSRDRRQWRRIRERSAHDSRAIRRRSVLTRGSRGHARGNVLIALYLGVGGRSLSSEALRPACSQLHTFAAKDFLVCTSKLRDRIGAEWDRPAINTRSVDFGKLREVLRPTHIVNCDVPLHQCVLKSFGLKQRILFVTRVDPICEFARRNDVGLALGRIGARPIYSPWFLLRRISYVGLLSHLPS